MSKIGRLPIFLPENTTVSLIENVVTITGVKGEERYTLPAGVLITIEEGKVLVSQVDKTNRQGRAAYGLTRALLANMVKGVSKGFEKKLELVGVGYRAQMQGNDLSLSLGYSHPVKFKPLDGVKISVADSVITVSGNDKGLVGQMADNIREARPPEPYKGKGIRYAKEHVRRKVGKAAKAVGAK